MNKNKALILHSGGGDSLAIMLEYCEKYGFRFGFGIFMIFVPCYSVQNGYYDSNVTVFYNDKKVLDAVSSEET